MKVSTFAATLGLGMLAGAAAILMLPKHSKVYRAADSAANTIKDEITDFVEDL